MDIPTALEYLLYNFGKVTSEEVLQKETEVISMIWQLSDLIILLTRPLEQLKKLVWHVGIPYTSAQILEKVASIIRATRNFKLVLTQWENKLANDKM